MYLNLPKATPKGKQSNEGFKVTTGNQTQNTKGRTLKSNQLRAIAPTLIKVLEQLVCLCL